MKKQLFVIILLIIASLLFSSCSRISDTSNRRSTSDSEVLRSKDTQFDAYSDQTDRQSSNTEPTGGGEHRCEVHFYDGYHYVDTYYLRDYLMAKGITDEDIDLWLEEAGKPDVSGTIDCPTAGCNIRAFVQEFAIPRNIFEEACRNMSSCWYNPDVIYSDDPNAADEFYRDLDARYEDSEKLINFHHLEGAVIQEFGKTEEDQLIVTFGPERVSILGLVKRFDVPRSFFEEYWAKQDKEYQESIPPFMPGDDPDDQPPEPIYHYDYDLDVLYNEDGTPKTYEDKTEYEIDAMFCGVEELFLGY